eukprot:Colp12_sorted_trinity150504_noHs@35754
MEEIGTIVVRDDVGQSDSIVVFKRLDQKVVVHLADIKGTWPDAITIYHVTGGQRVTRTVDGEHIWLPKNYDSGEYFVKGPAVSVERKEGLPGRDYKDLCPPLPTCPPVDNLQSILEADPPFPIRVSNVAFPNSGFLSNSGLIKYTFPLLEATLTVALVHRAQAGGTQMSHIWDIDTLFTHVVHDITSRICEAAVEYTRDSQDEYFSGLSSHQCRPDFILKLNKVPVVVGEEETNSFKKARKDLRKKFSFWNPLYLGSAPYIFAYAACWPNFQLFVITPDLELTPVTKSLLLDDIKDRLNLVRTALNLSRILVPLEKELPDKPLPLFSVLERPTCRITFSNDGVHKKVLTSPVGLESLETLYETVNLCPNAIHGKVSKEHKSTITITPLAVSARERAPRNEDELRHMVTSVLETLQVFHQGGYVHRDIRIDNILYDNGSWLLADFENSCEIGFRSSYRIGGVPDELVMDGWTPRADLFLVSNLFSTELGFALSDSAELFALRLRRDYNTAEECLLDPWAQH